MTIYLQEEFSDDKVIVDHVVSTLNTLSWATSSRRPRSIMILMSRTRSLRIAEFVKEVYDFAPKTDDDLRRLSPGSSSRARQSHCVWKENSDGRNHEGSRERVWRDLNVEVTDKQRRRSRRACPHR
jgi:hypothetical protein